MVFNLPTGLLMHDNTKAFLEWHKNNEIIDFIIGILSIIVSILLTFTDLVNIIKENYLFSTFIFLLVLIYLSYKFFKWKLYNFKKTKMDINSTLIINHTEELMTINIAENIIIPSEDILMLNLTLKFDDDIIKDLKQNKEYEIIFDKPTNLEINYVRKEHYNAEVLSKDPFGKDYKVKFDYRNNYGDTHEFELESDLDTTGKLQIFFRTPSNDEIVTTGFFKDKPLFCKEIYTTEVSPTIKDQNNIITVPNNF